MPRLKLSVDGRTIWPYTNSTASRPAWGRPAGQLQCQQRGEALMPACLSGGLRHRRDLPDFDCDGDANSASGDVEVILKDWKQTRRRPSTVNPPPRAARARPGVEVLASSWRKKLGEESGKNSPPTPASVPGKGGGPHNQPLGYCWQSHPHSADNLPHHEGKEAMGPRPCRAGDDTRVDYFRQGPIRFGGYVAADQKNLSGRKTNDEIRRETYQGRPLHFARRAQGSRSPQNRMCPGRLPTRPPKHHHDRAVPPAAGQGGFLAARPVAAGAGKEFWAKP